MAVQYGSFGVLKLEPCKSESSIAYLPHKVLAAS